ncbi:hypothetical protein [Streptacidiphilus cavernicola]|uniref:Uncharacterized protein n=1 Tax=Streptacidiphilus cavernicola TaxID=3342716 RepID=A0ABV6VPD3_9ACTN
MTTGSVVRSSWRSFIGRSPSPSSSLSLSPAPGRGRGRDGHTLRQRFWASFTGLDLPPVRSARLGAAPAHATTPGSPPVAPRQPPPRRRTGGLPSGRFLLPRLPQVGGLTADGGDAVLVEASSPDGSATFLVRGHGTTPLAYSLELVVHGRDATRPLMTSVGYAGPDGVERLLLVPVVRARIGPPASYVRLPDLSAEAELTASAPVPVSPESASAWDAATVAASVRAALNEATREAWRQVRESVADDGLGAVIDRELR